MGRARVKQWQAARAEQSRLLWIAYAVSEVMSLLEIVTGILVLSASLQADSLETGNSIAASKPIVKDSLSRRQITNAALVGVICVVLFCFWIVGFGVWNLAHENLPRAFIMMAVGFLSLFANIIILVLLRKRRLVNASINAAWGCARNGAVGNLGVIIAAAGVFITHQSWPDLVVALIMIPFVLRRAVRTMRDVK
mgnify:CR=1 FL=1